jgi:beta-lactamase regulating signal transducer with metallopeptidase domain
MPEITHSPFLQALGYSIINSLWQFALLWLIYVSINTLFKLSSHQKYSTGLLLQFLGFTWFTITFTFYFNQFSNLPNDYSLNQPYFLHIAHVNSETVRERFLTWIIQTERLLPYLSISYLAFLIFSCCKWIKAYNYTFALRNKGLQKVEVTWRIFVQQISIQLGIKREVKIYLSEMVQTPLTIGFFKPLILLPLASINNLNAEQMEAVIMHELAHIKRCDYLFNLFLALIEITLFFNPFMLLISRHIKRERENCCDDWVLQYEYSATSYAYALLQISTSQSSSPILAMKAAEDKHILFNRIRRIIEKKEISFFNYRYQLIAFIVMLTVLSSLALLSSSRKIDKAAVSSSPRKVITKQMTVRVNNALLNPGFFLPPPEKEVMAIKEQKSEKNKQKDFSFSNPSIAHNGIKTTNQQNNRKKNRLNFKASQVNPEVFSKGKELPEGLEKDAEILDVRLDEVVYRFDALKERELSLAEEKLKELALHLFHEKKAPLFDEKKIMGHMKAALKQIKLARIQLELAKQKIRVCVSKRVDVKETQLIPPFAPRDIDKLQRITEELEVQTERNKERTDRVLKEKSILS